MSTPNLPPKQLWKNYHACKKPHCSDCLQQGIARDEYKFCSTEEKPLIIYDPWGKPTYTFNHIYACNVYHWTIYHGQQHSLAAAHW
jgi:hypothetical protein